MEHFTRSIHNGLENDEEDDLDPKVNYADAVDIEALLNRSRPYGYKRTKAFEEAPEFVHRLDPFVEVEAGTSLIFECQWKGFPKPSIKWYRDDEEINSDHPYYETQTDDQHGIARLVLTEVVCSDEGAFKCKAENQEGVASTTGYLSVTGDKYLTLAQQERKSTSNSSSSSGSPTSPNPAVSTAPHLTTILEQQSVEEREAEAQKRLPPSPLQDYIEIVQKTKTWPLAKMGYNPSDFLPKPSRDNTIEDSDSDTSVESQTDDHGPVKVTVHTPIKQQSHGKVVITTTKNTHSKPPAKRGSQSSNTDKEQSEKGEYLTVDYRTAGGGSDNDSVHSFDSTEDIEEDSGPPVCTVNVQMRQSSDISRLARIRSNEAHRLSLTLSDDGGNLDMQEEYVADVNHTIEEEDTAEDVDLITPIVSSKQENQLEMNNDDIEESKYRVNETEVLSNLDDSQNTCANDQNISKSNAHAPPIEMIRSVDSDTVWFLDSDNQLHTEDSFVGSEEAEIPALDDLKDQRVQENNISTQQQNISQDPRCFQDSSENTPQTEIAEELSVLENDNVDNLERPHLSKLNKITSSSKKAIVHQLSKERKIKLKRQRSLAELSLEWLLQKVTGKAGEHLDLPWIYYFAFTVFCACFAAAIRLNPFYMIVIVALLSLLSFRFLQVEEVVENDEFMNKTKDREAIDEFIVENQQKTI